MRLKGPNRRGSAILTSLVLAMVFLGLFYVFQQWSVQSSHRLVNRMERQRALNYAESGVADAMDKIRSPGAMANYPPNAPQAYTVQLTQGRYEVIITRSATDFSNIVIKSSGFYYYPGGPQSDNLGKFQRAVIQVTVNIRSIDGFFAAVPGVLNIAPGTKAQSGMVYGSQVNFLSDATSPHTEVQAAYYFQSVTPSDKPINVDFYPTGASTIHNAIQYPVEPTLVRLDKTLQTMYSQWATGSPPVTSPITGTLNDPGNHHVLFCTGDVTLGQSGSDLTVAGPVVLYVTGTATIVGNILPIASDPTKGLVLLAENGIVLSQTAPAVLTLWGTFVTNGPFYAEPVPTGTLRTIFNFNGGFQALGGTGFDVGWPTRNYTYYAAPTAVILPYFLDTVEYLVLEGKFNQ